MPMDHNALIDAISMIAQNRDVTVTVSKSARAGAIAGGSCFVGALLGGPFGLVVGGLVGTALAYNDAGDIKPLYQVLNEELTEEQKAQLTRKLQQAFSEVDIQDVAMLAAFILRNSNMQEQAIKIAIDYVSGQLSGR